MKKIKVAGLRQVLDLAQVEVLALPNHHGNWVRTLASLADQGINLEFLVVRLCPDDTLDVTLGVRRSYIAALLGLLRGTGGKSGEVEILSRDPVAMISLFPHGNRADVIGNFLSAFRDVRTEVWSIAYSLSAVSVLIDPQQVPKVLAVLGEYFELPG